MLTSYVVKERFNDYMRAWVDDRNRFKFVNRRIVIRGWTVEELEKREIEVVERKCSIWRELERTKMRFHSASGRL